VLLEMTWGKRSGLRDGPCRSVDGLMLLGWTCKKGTPELWFGERLSNGQVKEGSNER